MTVETSGMTVGAGIITQPDIPQRGASRRPLPAGEGWVREKRPHTPTPYHAAQPHRHSRPPTVIPAKAGIHPRPTDTPGYTGVLDSGLRRNDGEGRIAFLPHPTLSRRERARGLRHAMRVVSGTTFLFPPPLHPFPPPFRHSDTDGQAAAPD